MRPPLNLHSLLLQLPIAVVVVVVVVAAAVVALPAAEAWRRVRADHN